MFENITFNGAPLTFNACYKALWGYLHTEFGDSPNALRNGHTEGDWLAAYEDICWDEQVLARTWGVEMAD